MFRFTVPRVRPAIVAALLVLIVSSISFAFSGVDPTFSPAPSAALPANPDRKLVAQPDGKLIVYGGGNVADGKPVTDLFRLNADGTLDTGFSYCSCVLAIRSVMLQPDGKLILAGAAIGTNQAKVIRLLANGSIDPTFNVVVNTQGLVASEFSLVGVDPDGKVLVLYHSVFAPGNGFYIMRFLPDGTVDPSFTVIDYGASRTLFVEIVGYERLSDGRFYIGDNNGIGGFYSPHLKRYNADGTIDSAFSIPTVSWSIGGPRALRCLSLLSDTSLVIGGDFPTVNGVATPDLALLLPAGNIDTTFGPAAVTSVDQIEVDASNRIVARVTDGAFIGIRRYLADGTQDKSFTMASEVGAAVSNFTIDSSGRIYVMGASGGVSKYFRLQSDGSLDSSYAPDAFAAAKVSVTATAPDGDVYLYGPFDRINNIPVGPLARVNADGTVDAQFVAGSGFSSTPVTMLVQPDGKLLAAGDFTSYNGVSCPGIVRINADGSRDMSFAPAVSNVAAIALDSGGKILIGGSFSTVNTVARKFVARLNSDGTLDATFAPNITSGTNVSGIIVQPDGKIIVGGSFVGAEGFNRPNLIRFTATGALDASFDAGSISSIDAIGRQSTGKIIYLYSSRRSIKRVGANGAADATFPTVTATIDSGTTAISDMLIGSDDSIILGGWFDLINAWAHRNLARLGPDGGNDPNFIPAGTGGRVLDLAATADGKLIVAGELSFVDGNIRDGVARITVTPFASKTAFDFDGDGKADEVVFRPSENYWYVFRSSNSTVGAFQFGVTGDISAPADYDGDNITDLGIFRPSTGDWWWRRSIDGVTNGSHWGQAGDIPMPSDVNNDGRTDLVVYRSGKWFISGVTGFGSIDFGAPGDRPVIADFDGDGKFDPTIFRPSTGDWWWRSSINGTQKALHWGQTGDIPVPADYDGDGKTDCAVFRPSNGGWYVLNSHDYSFYIIGFGQLGDKPVSADFDGDGKADIAVFRPSDGVWYLWRTTSGFGAIQFGAFNDVPAENSFIH